MKYSTSNGLIRINFPSKVKSGNSYVDEVRAIYTPAKDSESAVIVLHGFTMNKESFLGFGKQLNQGGISTFHLDLPYHGERGVRGKGFESYDLKPSKIRLGIEQAVEDISDTVETLDQKGYSNIGLVGYSLGGICTLLAMGQQPRINKGVAVVAGGDLADLIFSSPIASYIAERLYEQNVDYESLTKELQSVESNNYAHNIVPENLLMINGTKDKIVPPSNTRKFLDAMIRNPNIEWRNDGHLISDFASQTLEHLKTFISPKQEAAVINSNSDQIDLRDIFGKDAKFNCDPLVDISGIFRRNYKELIDLGYESGKVITLPATGISLDLESNFYRCLGPFRSYKEIVDSSIMLCEEQGMSKRHAFISAKSDGFSYDSEPKEGFVARIRLDVNNQLVRLVTKATKIQPTQAHSVYLESQKEAEALIMLGRGDVFEHWLIEHGVKERNSKKIIGLNNPDYISRTVALTNLIHQGFALQDAGILTPQDKNIETHKYLVKRMF